MTDDYHPKGDSQYYYCTILSISDVHGQGLFFSPLREPLVFNSPRFKNSGHMTIFLWLCRLQNTDHVNCHFGSEQPKWHHMISVLQTIRPQHQYHVTRIFEPPTKTNGPWRGLKKGACLRTSETDSVDCCGCPVLRKTDSDSTKWAIKEK